MASESIVQVKTLESFMISTFSAEQIDLYHEQKKRAAFEKQQLIVFHRQKRQARRALLRSGAVILSIGALFVYGVNLDTQLAGRSRHIDSLQREIRTQIRENEDAKKRIEDSVNILALREQAISYGMIYPEDCAIVYYTVGDTDYMCAY